MQFNVKQNAASSTIARFDHLPPLMQTYGLRPGAELDAQRRAGEVERLAELALEVAPVACLTRAFSELPWITMIGGFVPP